MNFLARKAFLEGLDEVNFELARQQLHQAGFDINNILSVPVFWNNKTTVDWILSVIKPISGQWNAWPVSMVDYGSFNGWRRVKNT